MPTGVTDGHVLTADSSDPVGQVWAAPAGGAVAAEDVTIADAGNDFTATDVEGALAELQADHEADATGLSDHLADAVGAHAATAVSFAPAGTIAATTVQAAIEEVALEAGGGGVDWEDVGGAAGIGGAYTEMVYTQITADVSITATTEGTANTIITAGAFTADGSSAYLVECWLISLRPSNTAGRSITAFLFLDGSSVGIVAQAVAQSIQVQNYVPCYIAHRVIPAAGSRTYSVRAAVSAGTGVAQAGVGGAGAAMPGYIRVTKVT